jgi:acetyl-CoA decarbonylase/synthase complex subunit gamma
METGRFATDELITRIEKARLREVVSHRRLILPQLGAPGVSGEEVRGYTGFDILSGPARAADIPAYLARGSSTTPHMRAVRFALRDRLALSPAELGRSLVSFSVFAFGALIVAGLGPDGVSLGRAWAGVWPIFALGLGSVCAGSFLVPVFLPLIPLPTFSAKGWVMGALVTASLLHGAGLASGMEPFLVAACYLFFPAASAALALRFAGAAPSACFPGARSEIRHSCPFFAAAAFLTAAALALSKLTQWGVL